jgi:hypothetical protein
MPAYLVELPVTGGRTLPGGHDKFIVFAHDDADAKDIVKDQFSGDSDALVSAATVTEVVAATELENFSLRVAILDSDPVVDVTVVGVDGATVDTIAALAVTALNALSSISAAAYNSTTQVLTVAGVADELGDKTLLVEFYGPNGRATIAGFVGAVVDGGAAEDELTVTLAADARVKPIVLASLKA